MGLKAKGGLPMLFIIILSYSPLLHISGTPDHHNSVLVEKYDKPSRDGQFVIARSLRGSRSSGGGSSRGGRSSRGGSGSFHKGGGTGGTSPSRGAGGGVGRRAPLIIGDGGAAGVAAAAANRHHKNASTTLVGSGSVGRGGARGTIYFSGVIIGFVFGNVWM
ncbi:hypothetical protein Sjap_012418 [Stephania japonica]|uniref:Glycine-rich protein n=1 Tax=Stephania japonica TaxID=461633 RepID=A0AAP0P0B9_9MAGN